MLGTKYVPFYFMRRQNQMNRQGHQILKLAREGEDKLLEYDGVVQLDHLRVPMIYNYCKVFDKWISENPHFTNFCTLVEITKIIAEYCSDDFIEHAVETKSINNICLVNNIIVQNRVRTLKKICKMGLKIPDTDLLQNFTICVHFSRTEILTTLFDLGYEFSKLDSYTMYSCMKHVKDEETLKLLLDNGAYINCRGYVKNTLLHYFVLEQKFEIVEMLLKYGADPTIRNDYHEYPHNEINLDENDELARNLYHQMQDACLEIGMKRIKLYS